MSLYDELAYRYNEVNSMVCPSNFSPSNSFYSAYCLAAGYRLENLTNLSYDSLRYDNLVLLERAMALVDGSAKIVILCGLAECHRGDIHGEHV